MKLYGVAHNPGLPRRIKRPRSFAQALQRELPLEADVKPGKGRNAPLHTPLINPFHPVEMPFRMPFVGEGEFFTPDSVLSHCYGALLPMFTTKEATTLSNCAGSSGALWQTFPGRMRRQ